VGRTGREGQGDESNFVMDNSIIWSWLNKHVLVKFYIHCSVHHYDYSKIITNKMTLVDYPLFQG